MPSNSTTLAMPIESKSAGVMSVQVRPPSPEVHRMEPKAPSKPMAISPSPPAAICSVALFGSEPGTHAGSKPTIGGSAGLDGYGVAVGAWLGDNDAVGGSTDGAPLGPGTTAQPTAVTATRIARTT